MESCAPGWILGFFPLIEKLPTPVCSYVPDCKPKGIAVRAKVEQKGRVIFLFKELLSYVSLSKHYTYRRSDDTRSESYPQKWRGELGLQKVLLIYPNIPFHRCYPMQVLSLKLLAKIPQIAKNQCYEVSRAKPFYRLLTAELTTKSAPLSKYHTKREPTQQWPPKIGVQKLVYQDFPTIHIRPC